MTMELAKKHYRLQLICYGLILLLTFASLLVLHFNRSQFLPYVLLVCVSATAISVFSAAVQPKPVKATHKIRLWRKLVQWLGFLVAVYLDLLTLKYGMASAVTVGMFALILLATTLFFLGTVDYFPMAILGMTIAMMLGASLALPDYLLLLVVLIPIAMSGLMVFLMHRHYITIEVA